MAFTLTFTFVVTPFVIFLGLIIALTVNALHSRLKPSGYIFLCFPL